MLEQISIQWRITFVIVILQQVGFFLDDGNLWKTYNGVFREKQMGRGPQWQNIFLAIEKIGKPGLAPSLCEH